MICQVSITSDQDRVILEGPYSISNRSLWTALGGRFSGSWIFPAKEIVKRAIEEKFGSASHLVEVEITADDIRIDKANGQWQLGGYLLAYKRTQIGETIMPDGVRLIEGEWANVGGSQTRPMPTPRPGGAFILGVVMRRNFAIANHLQIIGEDTARDPILEGYTIEALQAEINHRLSGA